MENCRITKLQNGITVISENISYVKSFSLGFWFNVGSRDESAQNNGISHFLEHMIFKGTKKRNAGKIAEEIESLGGYLNAFTSKEQTCFYGRGLEQHLEKTFEVLSDMIQNSVFNPEEIEKEASVVIDELRDIEDSPEELIFDKFEGNLFKGNSLSYPIIGTERNLRTFTKDKLQRFVKENYTNDNLFIVASGAVDHKKLVSFAEKYFNRKTGKSFRKREPVILNPAEDMHVFKDIQQVHLIIGKPTFGFDNKDRVKVSILSHILGDASSSRLFQSVREKNGIAYQINSFLNSFTDISTFGVYLSTNNKSVEKASDLIYKEFKKLRTKKVPEKELKKAKEFLKGNILMSLESTTNRMLRIAHSIIYYDRIKTVDETVKDIESVASEDILETAKDLLKEKTLKKIIISSKNLLLHSVA